MKYLYLFFCCLTFLPAQAQWEQLNAGTTEPLTSIHFLDFQTGLVCGENRIWKTTNGGQNWSPVYTGSQHIVLEEVRWASSQIAVAVGINAESNLGYILRSTNGGQDWSPVSNSITSLFTAVFFASESVGYLCGGNTRILKTTNGGSSWTSQFSDSDSDLFALHFLNENEGFAVGGVAGTGRILHTTDGGENWDDLSLTAPYLLQAVHFPSAQTGYVAGQNGKMSKTKDGGENWQSLTTLNTHNILDVEFLNDAVGYAVGGTLTQTSIQFTVDGGENWIQEAPNAGAGLFSIDLADGVGFAAGVKGTILQTQLPSGTFSLPEIESAVRISPNPVLGKTTVETLGQQLIRSVEIYDAGGQVVRSAEFLSTKISLDFSGLPAGNYYLKVSFGEEEAVRKVIKLGN